MESCPIFLKRIIEECFWQISNKISVEKHLKQSNRLFLVRKRFSFSANVWFIADNFCGKGCLVWILGCVDEYLWIFSDIFQCVPVTRTHNQFYFPPRPLLTSAVPRPRQKKQKPFGGYFREKCVRTFLCSRIHLSLLSSFCESISCVVH